MITQQLKLRGSVEMLISTADWYIRRQSSTGAIHCLHTTTFYFSFHAFDAESLSTLLQSQVQSFFPNVLFHFLTGLYTFKIQSIKLLEIENYV